MLDGARRDDAALPETVQGIIAARLDTLATRGEGARSRTRPWSEGSSGSARSAASAGRSRSGCTRSSARSSCAANRRSSVAGEAEYTLSPRARARRRLRADPEGPAGREAPSRRPSGWSRSAGPRTTPRCSRTTTEPRSSTPGDGQDTSQFAERAGIAFREAGDRAFALHTFTPRRPLLRAGSRSRGRRPGAPRSFSRTGGALAIGRATSVGRRRPRAARASDCSRRQVTTRARRRRRPSWPKPFQLAGLRDRVLPSHREKALRARAARLPASPAKARVLCRVVAHARGSPSENEASRGRRRGVRRSRVELGLAGGGRARAGQHRHSTSLYRPSTSTAAVATSSEASSLLARSAPPRSTRASHNLGSTTSALGPVPTRATELFEEALRLNAERFGDAASMGGC